MKGTRIFSFVLSGVYTFTYFTTGPQQLCVADVLITLTGEKTTGGEVSH